MRPKQAAEVIGCSKYHVYWLINNGKLKAKRKRSVDNRHGFEYDITQKDAERAKRDPDQRNSRGKPKRQKGR